MSCAAEDLVEPAKSNRVVAFIDILGASEDALHDRVDQLVGKIFQLGRRMQWQHRIHQEAPDGQVTTRTHLPGRAQFSDCLLLWSDALTGLPPAELVQAIGSFMWNLSGELGNLLMAGVPFRAGVSEGPVFIQPELNIFAGRAIVEAVKIEGCQNWLGAAMLFQDRNDRILKRPDQIFLGGERSMFEHFLVGDFPVPVKDESVFQKEGCDVRAINWALAVQEQHESRPSYDALHQKLAELQATAGESVAEKYRLATAFLAEVERRFPDDRPVRRSIRGN